MKRILLVPAAIAALALLASVRPASAGTSAPANLSVAATVAGYCTISPATLDFGSYDPTSGSANTAQVDIVVTCTKGSSFWVAMGNGANYTSSRRMAGGTSEFLNYDLYRDSGYATVWGVSDPAPTFPHTNATSAGTYNTTVFGRIPAGQNTLSTGVYSDTVAMTVHF